MTFSQLCRDMRCTPEEREKLAWHLAMLRAKETFDRLKHLHEMRGPSDQ